METKESNVESCKFYLEKKKRFCRFKPKLNQSYCPEHACIIGVSGDRKRIPCPLNPTHNCYEDDLEKHLKKCNVTKIKQAFEQSAYFKKGINKDCESAISNVELKKISVKELTSSQLATIIERINKLYDMHVEKIKKAIYEHDCVYNEICDTQNNDLRDAFGSQATLRKELLQQASLVGQLERLSLLNDGNCFVELGAGKGKLSHWIQKASKICKQNSFVLVERSSVRYKMDSFHKLGGDESCFQRIKIDIEDLNLGCVPEVQKAKNVVVVGKHLCGGATDMGIRCATNTLGLSGPNMQGCVSITQCAEENVHASKEQQASTHTHSASEGNTSEIFTNDTKIHITHNEPPAKVLRIVEHESQLKGIMIALCCHHQCTWNSYSGKEFMQHVGVSPEDFDLLTRLSSWATCAKLTAKSMRETSASNKEKTTAENHSTEDLVGNEENKSLREQLSVSEREEIGRKSKRLIDAGRMHYLQSKGLNCFLREYIDESVTPENVVLIALSSTQRN